MKKFLYIILSLLLVLTAVGCEKSPNKYTSTQVKGSELNIEKTSTSLDEKVTSENGIFIGQIDNNSIEIKINGTAAAFRFTDVSKTVFEQLKLKEMDSITVYYFKNSEGQNIIIRLEKVSKK